ncbi:ParB/RepB/Spo0J family partition protein [Sphingomonas sp. TX0543]|uniref:ParB/RepB/Spo0J family partition protein n=1 Tax=unclassified Sphingomonas TaxID=196159 RepID=UPI00148560FE|nr:ParB N-terminal domain-containing protein [Sphingomonas sp. 3P27F8]
MPNQLPLPSFRSTTRIVHVDPATVRLSSLNPRARTSHSPDSVAALADEIKEVGQINDAHGETAKDGVIELFAGSRRREACIVAGVELRIRMHTDLPRDAAIGIAYRDDREAVPVSLWDLSDGWSRMLGDGIVKTEAALAKMVGVDKSTMNRGLAFQKAPAAILDAFPDRRAISLTQWIELAPLIENDETRARLIERAGLIASKGYAATRVAAELKAAAANKAEIRPFEVRNRHDKVIATVQPDHRGGFAIKVKPMLELHPSYRLEFAKLIHDRFAEVLKTWFDRDV